MTAERDSPLLNRRRKNEQIYLSSSVDTRKSKNRTLAWLLQSNQITSRGSKKMIVHTEKVWGWRYQLSVWLCQCLFCFGVFWVILLLGSFFSFFLFLSLCFLTSGKNLICLIYSLAEAWGEIERKIEIVEIWLSFLFFLGIGLWLRKMKERDTLDSSSTVFSSGASARDSSWSRNVPFFNLSRHTMLTQGNSFVCVSDWYSQNGKSENPSLSWIESARLSWDYKQKANGMFKIMTRWPQYLASISLWRLLQRMCERIIF